jgi:type I restriction enzyme R subunit
VAPAPVVIGQLEYAKRRLDAFMRSQGLSARAAEVANLKGDYARAEFVKLFKDVQRLTTRLDQYTDLSAEQAAAIERILPENDHRALRGAYLATAEAMRQQQEKPGETKSPGVDQLDFDLVLFASATIDYDYIMRLIADFSMQKPGKATMSREDLIGLIAGDAKFLDERDAITEYVRGLAAGQGLDEAAIRVGYERFKAERAARELGEIAALHGVADAALRAFVEGVVARRVLDGERLTELLAPLDLGWKERARREVALMGELVPVIRRRAGGREISGLRVYED